MKTCSKCGIPKELSEYHKQARNKDGLFSYCKSCCRLATESWKKANPEKAKAISKAQSLKHRDKRLAKQRERYWANHDKVIAAKVGYRLKSSYNMTLEDYNQLLITQDGKCAICNCTPENEQYGKLHVDHDHETGKVRGLLCGTCNTGLGKFRDNIKLLEQAINYLSMKNVDIIRS